MQGLIPRVAGTMIQICLCLEIVNRIFLFECVSIGRGVIDPGCSGNKIKYPSGFERLRKKLFPETFSAMGFWEAPGFSSQVATQM